MPCAPFISVTNFVRLLICCSRDKMVIISVAMPSPLALLAEIITEKTPEVSGTPEIIPVALLTVRPEGNVPDGTVNASKSVGLLVAEIVYKKGEFILLAIVNSLVILGRGGVAAKSSAFAMSWM